MPPQIIITVRQDELLRLIKTNGTITRAEIAERLKVSEPTVKRDIKYLREQGILNYDGAAKTGKWIVNPNIGITVKQRKNGFTGHSFFAYV